MKFSNDNIIIFPTQPVETVSSHKQFQQLHKKSADNSVKNLTIRITQTKFQIITKLENVKL